MENIEKQCAEAVKGLLEVAGLKPGQVLVLGCSTSEIQGKRIGSYGNMQIASAVLNGIEKELKGTGIFLAVQCCEHLNRALVVERQLCEKYGLTQVAVLPVPTAGGAAASAGMARFSQPVVVESIQAHAGIDIGDTLIGMHLRPVAVPVRLRIKTIGEAHVTMARTRPKLIGGARAVYAEDDIDRRFGKGVCK